MPFTTFALVQVGLSVFASVYTVAQAILGSLLVAGNLYFDTTNNNYPSILVNSGSVASYIGEDDVRGGGKRLVISGSYLRAEVQLPTIYASGGYLRGVIFDCGGTPVAISGSLSIRQYTKLGLNAVTPIRRDILVGTGRTTVLNTGSVITTKIPTSFYVSFIGSGGVGLRASSLTGTDCVMKPELRDKYGR